MKKSDYLGRINQVGYYADDIPKYIVLLTKTILKGCFRHDRVRVPVTLVFMGKKYSAGLRRTTNRYMKICPDLLDEMGNPARLSEILLEYGLESKETIGVNISDGVVELFFPLKDSLSPQ